MTDAPARPLPVIGRDSEFFWEGARNRQLLVQCCSRCGTLRHPPRPICSSCRSFEWTAVSTAGKGSVYSYVVHEHPPIPGFSLPLVLALVDLHEGVRVAGAILDVDPRAVTIGMRVEVTFEEVTPECVLPQWRLARPEGQSERGPA